jgi:hypothetical protein
MQKYYKAEMDRLLRVSTKVVWALFLVPPVVLAGIWYKTQHLPAGARSAPPFLGMAFAWGLPVFAVFIALTAHRTKALAPKGYAINDIELIIDRARKPITIPLREIQEVRTLEDGLLRHSLRLLGTSGFYGYYGLFWNRKLGKFRVYATRLNRLVAVKAGNTLYALTPDNPEDFRKTLLALVRR